MRTTITQAHSSRAPHKDSLLDWVKREMLPLVREARRALNYLLAEKPRVESAGDGAWVELWRGDELPLRTTVVVEARVLGMSTSTKGIFNEVGCFSNNGTTTSQVLTSTNVYAIADAGLDVRTRLDGQVPVVEVKDDGVTALTWSGVVWLWYRDE